MQATSRALKTVLLVTALAIIAVGVAKFGRNADLSHVKVAMFSGSADGNYHAIVAKAAAQAQRERGRIDNLTSAGSVETMQRLAAAKSSCDFNLRLCRTVFIIVCCIDRLNPPPMAGILPLAELGVRKVHAHQLIHVLGTGVDARFGDGDILGLLRLFHDRSRLPRGATLAGMCARLAIVAFAVGITACASSPMATTPYVGEFTGEYVDGAPLYRFPTIEVVGTRRSVDKDM